MAIPRDWPWIEEILVRMESRGRGVERMTGRISLGNGRNMLLIFRSENENSFSGRCYAATFYSVSDHPRLPNWVRRYVQNPTIKYRTTAILQH
jgi:hypothetical protein